ncbi:hypothetical protein ACOMHN_051476 [Nucella lapillus]
MVKNTRFTWRELERLAQDRSGWRAHCWRPVSQTGATGNDDDDDEWLTVDDDGGGGDGGDEDDDDHHGKNNRDNTANDLLHTLM